MTWHAIVLSFLCNALAFAWELPVIHESPAVGDFMLAANGLAAPILFDPSEAKVVRYAADQLASDIGPVANLDSQKIWRPMQR